VPYSVDQDFSVAKLALIFNLSAIPLLFASTLMITADLARASSARGRNLSAIS